MATLKEILDKFTVEPSGTAPSRAAATKPDKVAHVSDPSKPIQAWDHFRKRRPDHPQGTGDGALPDEVVAQVVEARSMLPTVALPKAAGKDITLDCAALGCSRDKCYQYISDEDLKAVDGKLLAEALGYRKERDAATDAGVRAEKHRKYLQAMAFRLLMGGREGPSTAINTYDTAIFTWGMGWAGTGKLGGVLAKIYEMENGNPLKRDINDRHVQKLFYLCGFLWDEGTYFVVDTANKVVAGGFTKVDRDAAYRVIHDTDELHYMWILAARDALTADVVLDAQRQYFFQTTGNVTDIDSIHTGALYTFVAHLQHWTASTRHVVKFAKDPRSKPPLTATLPSIDGDKHIAVNAVREFYETRSPNHDRNDFGQVRKYWSQMLADASKEGVAFAPEYAIMVNPPEDAAPAGHLTGTLRGSTKVWDLGPVEDFHRVAPAAEPAQAPPADGAPPSQGTGNKLGQAAPLDPPARLGERSSWAGLRNKIAG
ncbi:MAG: hypothetical protein QM820_32445 [Minicystis sp.]